MAAKKLGLLDATLLVSGSMIGSGVFIVAADMTRQVGSSGWLMLAWVLTGVMTLMAALSFGEMGAMMPHAGGQYNYISRAYGRPMAFVYGWSVFSVIQTGVIAAVAMAFAKYLAIIVPSLNESDALFWGLSKGQGVAILSIVLLTLINARGIQESKWVQRLFTWAKLTALFGLILTGIYCAISFPTLWNNFQGAFQAQRFNGVSWESISGLALATAFSGAMVGSLFSSDAWQGLTFMSDEVDAPTRNIPKALVFGTLLVTVVYCLTQMAYLSILPLKGDAQADSELLRKGIAFAENDRVGAAAAAGLFSGSTATGSLWMAVLIVISTFGCNNGLIMAGSRLFRAMASQGYFFRSAAKTNSAGMPVQALWMQGAWASVLCLSGSYGELLEYCTFASLFFYLITVVGLFRLRIKEPETERPYRVWGYPWIPLLYSLLASAICLGILTSKFESSVKGLALVALGFPIYGVIQRLNAQREAK